MGFTLIATGVLGAYLPYAPWRTLVENLGYTVGFLIVIMGRQQLFTENTVTAVVPMLDDFDGGRTLLKMLRLWIVVLAGNVIGAILFSYAAAHTNAFDAQVKSAFAEIAAAALAPSSMDIFVRGIFSGWLIALMVWLLPAAEGQRVSIIIIMTYIVGAAGLSHVIAGSVEALYGVASGSASWSTFWTHFFFPVLAGNTIGGVALVALLNYAQVAPESNENGDESTKD